MANTGRIVKGTTPRLLQYGVDKIIDHFSNIYVGVGETLFDKVKTDKGFYEIVQLAGMGLAGRKNESDQISTDSLDQDFNQRYDVFTYEKSARISMEAIEDNVYENMLELIGRSLVKSHKENMDYQMVSILNNATTTNLMDGVPLLSTAHPLQAGGTNTNRLSPDLDLSEDAVESAIQLIDNFLNPDGLQSDYYGRKLVVPVALKYVAERIVASKYRTATSDNDVNAVMNRQDIDGYLMWKRLTSQSTWFITTDAPNGLMLAEKKALTTNTFKDPFSYDVIITAHNRFRALAADHRCIVGSVGP